MHEDIHFRPHHFLCTMNFQGKGYSMGFVRNYKKIVSHIQKNPDSKISIVKEIDSICIPCPNRIKNKCTEQSFITLLDQRHAEAFDFKPGDAITWRDALIRIAQRVTLPIFHTICEGCSWKSLGICEQGVQCVKEKVDAISEK